MSREPRIAGALIIKEKDADKLASEYQSIIMLGYFTNDIGRLEASLADFYKKVF